MASPISFDKENLKLEHDFIAHDLEINDSSVKGSVRKISYYKVDGSSTPGVVFIPGFMANKEHKKSIEILKYCQQKNIPCVREVLTKLTTGPQVVIGSSMGGWLSMILAQEIPDVFVGLVMLAPAYNFGRKALEEFINLVPQEIRIRMEEESGFVYEKIDPKFPGYGPVPLSYDLFKQMTSYDVPLEKNAIDIHFPVIILHGTEDEIIPVKCSEALIDAITSPHVSLLIIKGSTHELSDPKAIRAIIISVETHRNQFNSI